MSFFKRLANLGKGIALSKATSTSTEALEKELLADKMNPTPGLEAQAELARLKQDEVPDSGGPTSDAKKPTQDEAEQGLGDTDDKASRPKKTL